MYKFLTVSITAIVFGGCAAPPVVYKDEAATKMPDQKTVQILREFCLGGGRGLIHFDSVDGKTVRHQPQFQGGWPVKLILTPGLHKLKLDFQAPDASIWANWRGEKFIEYEFTAGKVYIVRYRRESVDQFRAWIEELNVSGDIDPLKPYCFQSEDFPDKRYIK